MSRSRRSRIEVNAMERRVTALIDTLRDSGDPVQFGLASRLWCCQQQREERRRGIRDRVDRPCRQVACESCRRRLSRAWRERAEDQMRDADNAHSSMVTIVLERVGDWSAVRNAVLRFRTALRNLRDRKARTNAQWRTLAVVGMTELDMLAVEDVPLLPPLRRMVIEALPACSYGGGMALIVHVHLAVSHPGLPLHAVERAFREQWDGVGRVDVRSFHDDAAAPENAGAIIAYATKQQMTIKLDGNVDTSNAEVFVAIEVEVPVEWQASYWGWLHGLGAGLAPLRVRMSAMRDTVAEEPAVVDVEPMPALWTYR